MQVDRYAFCNVQLSGDYSQPASQSMVTIGGGPAAASVPQSPVTIAPRPAPAQPNPARNNSDSARDRLIAEARSQPNPFGPQIAEPARGPRAAEDIYAEYPLCNGFAKLTRFGYQPIQRRGVFVVAFADKALTTRTFELADLLPRSSGELPLQSARVMTEDDVHHLVVLALQGDCSSLRPAREDQRSASIVALISAYVRDKFRCKPEDKDYLECIRDSVERAHRLSAGIGVRG